MEWLQKWSGCNFEISVKLVNEKYGIEKNSRKKIFFSSELWEHIFSFF